MKMILILLLSALFQTAYAFEQFISIDGPNCLNGALVASGLLPYHRYTSNSEMLLVLQSPVCRKINNSDRLKGDIGLIRDFGPYATPNVISHAFFYLGDKLSFEKRGYGRTEPYHIISTQHIINEYGVDEITSKNIEFYRCNRASKMTPKNLSGAYSEMAVLEDLLHQKIILEDGDFSQLKNKILKIAQLMKDFKISHHEQIEVDQIAARLVSISNQINALGDPTLREITAKWENETVGINGIFSELTKILQKER